LPEAYESYPHVEGGLVELINYVVHITHFAVLLCD
jgi:hypothetical protein